MVARVRCETQVNGDIVFLELAGRDSIVLSKDDYVVTVLMNIESDSSILQEALNGMKVGGRRKVILLPTTKTNNDNEDDSIIRFLGLGAKATDDNNNNSDDTIVMNLVLEAIEPPLSFNAILTALSDKDVLVPILLFI